MAAGDYRAGPPCRRQVPVSEVVAALGMQQRKLQGLEMQLKMLGSPRPAPEAKRELATSLEAVAARINALGHRLGELSTKSRAGSEARRATSAEGAPRLSSHHAEGVPRPSSHRAASAVLGVGAAPEQVVQCASVPHAVPGGGSTRRGEEAYFPSGAEPAGSAAPHGRAGPQGQGPATSGPGQPVRAQHGLSMLRGPGAGRRAGTPQEGSFTHCPTAAAHARASVAAAGLAAEEAAQVAAELAALGAMPRVAERSHSASSSRERRRSAQVPADLAAFEQFGRKAPQPRDVAVPYYPSEATDDASPSSGGYHGRVTQHVGGVHPDVRGMPNMGGQATPGGGRERSPPGRCRAQQAAPAQVAPRSEPHLRAWGRDQDQSSERSAAPRCQGGVAPRVLWHANPEDVMWAK